jgi:glycosyltransferase involved in cell wall biosynthesis
VLALAIVAFAGLAGWLAVLVHPARPWDLRPIAEDEPEPPAPERWPSVAVLVPARNEAAYLPGTLPALLAQDYPGTRRVILVDDRSSDGTAGVARGLVGTARGDVVVGAPLPEGWAGKVWALEQAARTAPAEVEYYLLTDADIRHAPRSLARLVAEAEAGGLALDSRMARLRCESRSERLLIPPFLFFFNLLYPIGP